MSAIADAVGASQEHGVVEGAVGGFRVVALGEEVFEVGVGGWDGPDV